MSSHSRAAAPLMLTIPALNRAFRGVTDSTAKVRRLAVPLVLLSIVALTPLADQEPGAGVEVGPAERTDSSWSSVVNGYGRLPMTFEQNAGQADESVRFLARGAGYSIFLTASEAILALVPDGESSQPTILRVATVGGAGRPAISGVDPQAGRVNYLTGDDPSTWRTGLATYRGVRYSGVYPGIDAFYYGNQRQLEYDFVVAPGADPAQIRLGFTGADRLRLSELGDLVVEIQGRQLVQQAPIVYQEVGGGRQTVEGRYVVDGDEVTFALGSYDHSLPLVIDPVITYSTYLGGSSSEIAYGIAVDGTGNAYVAGQTTSSDFPIAGAAQGSHGGGDFDAFVAKLNPGGTGLVYATYLGGAGFEHVEDLAIDGSGSAYVAGVTSSANFPTVNAFQSAFRGVEDAFLAKLNVAGSALVYSSYLGAAGDDGAYSIAVDGTGNAYVTGFTDSVAFPTVNPIQATKGTTLDAFVTKVNALGSAIIYSTYLGGNVDDLGYGIAVDGSGAAYVAGETLSSNFPTASPMQAAGGGSFDAFVTKLNPTGSALTYSTYLGGSGSDGARDIALDAAGNAYVTGTTGSTNFPTTIPLDGTRGGAEDAFVTKLNAAGTARVYSTYLGGSTADFGLSGLEEALAIAVDATGAAHVTGHTQSTDFPLVNAMQPVRGSFQDAFVAKINPAGTALQHASYLGGTGNHEVGQAIAVDASGAAYLTGQTDATNFPTTPAVLEPTLPSRFQGSAFVTKLTYEPPEPPTVSMGPDVRLAEGSPGGTTNFDFTIRLAWAHTQPVTVRYTTSAGITNPATVGSDYAAVTGGTVTIPAGQLSGIARVVVVRDETDELDETFRVTLSDPINAALGADWLAVGTILNDDDPTLSIADLTLAEGDSGTTTFPFAVSLSAASIQPVTVRYSTSAGITNPATAGIDYTSVTGALLTIPAGALSITAPVAVTGDSLGEANETFGVTLAAAVNATLGDGQAVGTITNDDGALLPTLTMGPDLNLAEGSPSGTTDFDFRITLSAASAEPVSVTYTTAAGNSNPAAAGSDYTAVTGATVSIPAGQTSAIARVVVHRDATDEVDETFRVTLSNPVNATLAGDGFAVGIIRNDDNPALSIADLTRAEGNSGTTIFPFAISLSAVSLEPVTVSYSTVAGTLNPATAGTDYTAVTNATLTIPAGALTASAPVAVAGDTQIEPDETFRVTVAAVNAIIVDGLAVGTIATDDDDTTAPTVGAPTTDFRSDLSLAASSTPIPIRVSFTASDASGIALTNLQQKVGTAPYANVALAPANATTKDLYVAPGSTTRRFRARATDGATPANTSAYSTAPAFRIKARQNGSTSVVQTGAWTTSSNTNFYGGSVRHTSVAGRTQRLTAVMTDVALVSTRASNRGMAKIFIDGVERATIDLYSASTQYRRVVYQFSFAGAAVTHTVELRVLGTKNAASTGTRVDFDAFLVMTP